MAGVSSLQRLLMVWSRDVQPGRTDTSQYRALLTEGGANHTLGTDQYVLFPVDAGGKTAIYISSD